MPHPERGGRPATYTGESITESYRGHTWTLEPGTEGRIFKDHEGDLPYRGVWFWADDLTFIFGVYESDVKLLETDQS